MKLQYIAATCDKREPDGVSRGAAADPVRPPPISAAPSDTNFGPPGPPKEVHSKNAPTLARNPQVDN